MAFLSSLQDELLRCLIDGIHDAESWRLFLRKLVAHSGAHHGLLVVGAINAQPGQNAMFFMETAPRASGQLSLDLKSLTQLQLMPLENMRAGRVYQLEELLDYADPQRLVTQREELAKLGIRYGRWLRISGDCHADAWIILVRALEDFTGSTLALLSALTPHFAAVLRAQAKFAEQQLRAALALQPLSRIGVGQLAFDRAGRVLAAEYPADLHLKLVGDPSDRRLLLPPATAREIEQACEAIADKQAAQAVIAIPVDRHRALHLALRPADLHLPESIVHPVAIGTVRIPAIEDADQAIATIAAMHGLTASEAALAHGLMHGEAIIEAGARLGLTQETARNYSKKIYAKTGTRGQADLVRLLFQGLAPFA